jgi:formylmethanofuran dehydrogenase subunit E
MGITTRAVTEIECDLCGEEIPDRDMERLEEVDLDDIRVFGPPNYSSLWVGSCHRERDPKEAREYVICENCREITVRDLLERSWRHVRWPSPESAST